MDQINISVVIPAYNEEKRITNVLTSMENTFGERCEIIVVCNGCIDNTPQLVRSMKKNYPNIKCLEFTQKLGKGGAILEGFKKAEGKYIGFIDADDSFENKAIKKMIDALINDECDCIIASKWKEESFGSVSEGTLRKILSRGWNFFVKMLFCLPFRDTQAGAKFLNKKVFESIDKNFICRGFDFDVELLWKIQKKNFKIREVYVPNRSVEGSKFSIKYVLPMFINLVRLWRRGR